MRHEPAGLRIVRPGSTADGATVGELALGESTWVIVVVRSGRLVPTSAATRLAAGDELLLLVDGDPTGMDTVFTVPRRSDGPSTPASHA